MKQRMFKTKYGFSGYVAVVTKGKALTEIEIMECSNLPQTVGCVKNNKCDTALDCMRAINGLLGFNLTWEIM